MNNDRQGCIPVAGGSVWYRIFGAENDNVPLLILHGGPGSTHDYLLPLREMADDRPVVFYDQLGSGNSDRPDDDSLWRLPRFVTELGQVRQSLQLDEVHILGSSWGTMLATEYMLTEPEGVISLTFSGPALSAHRWKDDVRKLLSGISPQSQRTIRRCEENGDFGSEDYQEAMMEFYRKHMCRLHPWPDYVQRSFEKMGQQVYEHMWGPSEFTITGNLQDFDRVDRLNKVDAPVLFICGQYDEATPETTEYYHRHCPASEFAVIENASHMHHVEKPVKFRNLVRDFISRAQRGSCS